MLRLEGCKLLTDKLMLHLTMLLKQSCATVERSGAQTEGENLSSEVTHSLTSPTASGVDLNSPYRARSTSAQWESSQHTRHQAGTRVSLRLLDLAWVDCVTDEAVFTALRAAAANPRQPNLTIVNYYRINRCSRDV